MTAIGREWITPDEQLKRLYKPLLVEQVEFVLPAEGLPEIVADYAYSDQSEPSEVYPENYTRWYTALKKIGMLPDRVPALPANIHDILKAPCPLPKSWDEKRKPDGTPWTVGDSHSLYLLPAGDIVGDLQAHCALYGKEAKNDRGEKLYPQHNPLQLFYASREDIRQDDVKTEAEWILMSNSLLEGSKRQTWKRQAELIQKISTPFLTYQAPSLKQAFGFVILHKVATGESVFYGSDVFSPVPKSLCTRVEAIVGRSKHLTVGGCDPSHGVPVSSIHPDHDWPGVGVAALIKL